MPTAYVCNHSHIDPQNQVNLSVKTKAERISIIRMNVKWLSTIKVVVIIEISIPQMTSMTSDGKDVLCEPPRKTLRKPSVKRQLSPP